MINVGHASSVTQMGSIIVLYSQSNGSLSMLMEYNPMCAVLAHDADIGPTVVSLNGIKLKNHLK
jgi:hypothetical protein